MRKASHLKLGLFLLACAGVGAVALIWVGATRIFESSKTYAAFFAEPVTGLQSGAPVKHLGVQIGRVDSVDLAPGDRVVQVLVKIRSGFRRDPSMALSLAQPGVTGSPFLALEDAAPDERKEPSHPPTRYPVLPVRPGGGGISAIERQLSSLDLQGLVNRWESVAARIDASIGDAKLAQIVDDVRAASLVLRRIAGPGKGGQPSRLDATARDLAATAHALKAAADSIASQVDAIPRGEVGDSMALLRQDLAQLRQAVAETRSLARSMRADPGRVLEQSTHTDPFRR